MDNKLNILVGFKKKQYKDYILLKNKFNELINNEKYYYLQKNKIPYFGEFEKLKKEFYYNILKKEFYYTIEFEIDLVSYENYKNEIEKLIKEVE